MMYKFLHGMENMLDEFGYAISALVSGILVQLFNWWKRRHDRHNALYQLNVHYDQLSLENAKLHIEVGKLRSENAELRLTVEALKNELYRLRTIIEG